MCMYVYVYIHINICTNTDSLTHADVILVYNMWHLGRLFWPWYSANVQMRYWATRIVIFDLPLLQVIWLSPDYVTQDPMSHSKLLNHSDRLDKTFAKLLLWEFFAWLVERWMSASLIIYRFTALHHLGLCLTQWALFS